MGDLEPTRWAAMVLCGGQSRRMGRPKAWLPFGAEPMIVRVLRILQEVSRFETLLVVAAPQQELPPLPSGIHLVRDAVPGRGPLEGVATGLAALQEMNSDRNWASYVTSCDVPLLQPAFIEAVCQRLQSASIAVPVETAFPHPLAAAYRITVLDVMRQLLERGEFRPRALFSLVPTVFIPVEELREVDPKLFSLKNINTPQDYYWALTTAGFTPSQTSTEDGY